MSPDVAVGAGFARVRPARTAAAFTLIELTLAIALAVEIILVAFMGVGAGLRTVSASNRMWARTQNQTAIWQACISLADRATALPGSGALAYLPTGQEEWQGAGNGRIWTVQAGGSGYQHAIAQVAYAADCYLTTDSRRPGGLGLYWTFNRTYDGAFLHPDGSTQDVSSIPGYPLAAGVPASTYDLVYPPIPGSVEGWPTQDQQHTVNHNSTWGVIWQSASPPPPSVGAPIGAYGRVWYPTSPYPTPNCQQQAASDLHGILPAGSLPATGASVVRAQTFLGNGGQPILRPRGRWTTIQPIPAQARTELWNQDLPQGLNAQFRDIAWLGLPSNGQFTIHQLSDKYANLDQSAYTPEMCPLNYAVTGAR